MDFSKDFKLIFKIILSFVVIVILGFTVYILLTKSNPFEEESIPEDVITLFDAIPYANKYIEEQQGEGEYELILIAMEISKEDKRGTIDLTYSTKKLIEEFRYIISIDTKEQTINGSVGDPRMQSSSLNMKEWTVDSDEIVEISKHDLEKRIGEFDYYMVRIHSAGSRAEKQALGIYFLNENDDYIENAKININPITKETEKY